jgi:SsrA-binding protein
MKILQTNKKAYFDYHIYDTLEVGIALAGSEVKSVKSNLVKLQGAYVIISDHRMVLINCHISHYPFAFQSKKEDPLRNRFLLLHKSELEKIAGKIQSKGFTALPLKIYITTRGYIKLEIGLAKHKKLHDKKQLLKEKDLDREAKRELKDKN